MLGILLVRNERKVTTKCLRSRITRSRDIGTAALSFLGIITGKLSSSAGFGFCRRMRGSLCSRRMNSGCPMAKVVHGPLTLRMISPANGVGGPLPVYSTNTRARSVSALELLAG